MDQSKLDTARSVETPEGVELALQVAGPVPRALAWLIDMLARAVIYFAVALTIGQLGDFGAGLFLLMLFVVEWFYPVLFEIYMRGATPGKRVLGLHVVHDDGTPVRWAASMIRNLMRGVDFLPFGYALGLTWMLFHPDFKRLGDLSAGTLVVYDDPAQEQLDRVSVKAQAPPWPLSPEEQQTIIDFAERRQRITPERADELARACAPLTDGAANPAAQLEAYAGWLAGER